MIHVLALFLISTLAGCASCSSDLKENGKENGKEEKPDTEEVRPESFASDDEMLDYIQKVHLNYMWDGAEPTSGLARERIHLDGDYPEKDQNVVTTGGSGFGIAGLLVGIERGFIPREEGVKRLTKIADYLKRADRFHGVWPHWLYGPTGKVKPFGQKDNGGDLVESCFLMQSLLCVRQYFRDGNEQEKALAEKIDQLWKEMEFSWYQNGIWLGRHCAGAEARADCEALVGTAQGAESGLRAIFKKRYKTPGRNPRRFHAVQEL